MNLKKGTRNAKYVEKSVRDMGAAQSNGQGFGPTVISFLGITFDPKRIRAFGMYQMNQQSLAHNTFHMKSIRFITF